VKILVGYVPTPEGEAALAAAAIEAELRGASILLLNTSRGDAYIDARYANADELAAAEPSCASTASRSPSSRRSPRATSPAHS